jgi:hypothetical protein
VSADTDPTPYLTEPQRVQNLYRAALRALHDVGNQLRAERAAHERTREELLRVRAERDVAKGSRQYVEAVEADLRTARALLDSVEADRDRIRAERDAVTERQIPEMVQQFDADTLATLEAWRPCIQAAVQVSAWESEQIVGFDASATNLFQRVRTLAETLDAARHGGPDGDVDYLSELA